MRSRVSSIIPLLAMFFVACTSVDADECWPNTSGGFGGGGTIPIGAGVGATSSGGDFFAPPGLGPLEADQENNPCMVSAEAEAPEEQAPETQAPTGWGIFIPIHKPSDFPFVTIVPDDGQDSSGGWQAAKANLPFTKFNFPAMITWYCPITIGMPIRHSIRGFISPGAAAAMSAAVTNSVASRMNFDLPQGVFCISFRQGVKTAFPAMYPDLGTKVGL